MDEMEVLLRRGLGDLGLPETAAPAMARYGALLLETNQVMNLTAITDPQEVATLHLLDSLILLLYDDRRRCLLYLVLLLYWIAHVMSLLHRVPVLSHVVSCAYIGMRWLTMMN